MGFFISIRFYFTNYKLGIIIKIQQPCYFTLVFIKIAILMSSVVRASQYSLSQCRVCPTPVEPPPAGASLLSARSASQSYRLYYDAKKDSTCVKSMCLSKTSFLFLMNTYPCSLKIVDSLLSTHIRFNYVTGFSS